MAPIRVVEIEGYSCCSSSYCCSDPSGVNVPGGTVPKEEIEKGKEEGKKQRNVDEALHRMGTPTSATRECECYGRG